ncbi:SH3 domain-containing protein [Flavobacterium sp. 245]|uniref:SH3 domain-containing protein n=1 Tax=Flavobacterium sp. 245 TaxID=2512115 RepID=UPI0010601560|nr:SH3 domain-containing protein [Flavobacterium sp. 245]TDO94964.1 SH3 domain-containing protein [Flavobacterium sp. 245]
MKKIIILIIVTSLIISCNSKTKKEEMESSKPTKLYQDKLYERYIPLMNKLLNDNNYKYPNHEDFRNKVINYFGVDIDTSDYNDVDIPNLAIAISSERFIDTYSLDRGNIDGAGDAFSEILKEGTGNEFNKDFIYYNKILFYDDIQTISKIINDTDRLENIVIYFDYEKNDLLNKNTINKIKNIDDFNDEFKFHLLWYNNKSKSEIIRKKMISDIAGKNSDFIIDLSYFLFKKKTDIKNSISDKLFYETLGYLLEVVLKIHDDEDTETNMAYRALNNLYEDDSNLLNKLQDFNFPMIQKYTKIYRAIKSEEQSISFGIINDQDGYTNLRKERSSDSEVIQKINTGDSVEILDNSGDWWLVQTKEGKKGYVYKTKIKIE